MEREKLIEELAKAICLDAVPSAVWERASPYYRRLYLNHAQAILTRLDQLGLMIVSKDALDEARLDGQGDVMDEIRYRGDD